MYLNIFQHNLSIVVLVGSNQQISLFLKFGQVGGFFQMCWIARNMMHLISPCIWKMLIFLTHVGLTADWSVFNFLFFLNKPCYHFEYNVNYFLNCF